MRRENTPTTQGSALDLTSDRRDLQGIPKFGYVVQGYFWEELAVWKVRVLKKASKSRLRVEQVELLWHQPKTKVNQAPTLVWEKDCFSTLLDTVAELGSRRDKYRQNALSYRVRLHEDLRNAQDNIEDITKKILELDKFNPNAVLPSDLLEAEDAEMERWINSVVES